MTWSWLASIGCQDGASSSSGDMYDEVDIPSLLEVFVESLVDPLRAMRNYLSTNLLTASRAI